MSASRHRALRHLPCPDKPGSPPLSTPQPEHSIPTHSGSTGRELEHLHSNWGCHRLRRATDSAPTDTQTDRQTDGLWLPLPPEPPHGKASLGAAPAAPSAAGRAGPLRGQHSISQPGSVFSVFLSIAGSTGLQGLLHSTFKMPGVILLFVPTAEQPTARAHRALHTPVPTWGDTTLSPGPTNLQR